jgi:hypothetical protein
MKNAVFWDVAPCSSCMNRHFGGTYRLHFQGRKIRERGTSVSIGLQTERQSKTTSYIRTERDSGPRVKLIVRVERNIVEMGKLIAGHSRYRSV